MRTIFFGPEQSIVEKMLADIKNSDQIEYYGFSLEKPSQSKLFRYKILKLLPDGMKKKLFQKGFANPAFLDQKSKDPTLMVFINTFALFGEAQFWLLLPLLKKQYPGAKFAFFYYAAIDYCLPELFPQVQQNFDLVMSFDRFSSEKHGTVFYGPINEKGVVEPDENCEESDVFFAGNHEGGVKGSSERTELTADGITFLSDRGKKCIFYLDGCKSTHKKAIFDRMQSSCADPSALIFNEDFIQYKDSVLHFAYLPYARSLGYLKKTKAIFEIATPCDQGYIYTARAAQAFGEGKKLITNSRQITREPFYRQANCTIFDHVSDIDLEVIDTPFEPIDYDFTGLSMVRFAEKKLFS